MKIILDENLSRKLIPQLVSLFEDVEHIADIFGAGSTDSAIWDYAKVHNAIILSKDDDFRQLATLHGFPPKVIWLNCGNLSNTETVDLLFKRHDQIELFISDSEESVLVIRRQ